MRLFSFSGLSLLSAYVHKSSLNSISIRNMFVHKRCLSNSFKTVSIAPPPSPLDISATLGGNVVLCGWTKCSAQIKLIVYQCVRLIRNEQQNTRVCVCVCLRVYLYACAYVPFKQQLHDFTEASVSTVPCAYFPRIAHEFYCIKCIKRERESEREEAYGIRRMSTLS